jgi:hypothetical protein
MPDRDMKLLEDFVYFDPDGRRWEAPKDSVVNGASIPPFLWDRIGSPYTENYRMASIVHDVACGDPEVPRLEADRMFYWACRAGGCPPLKASILYIGVRIGAWWGDRRAFGTAKGRPATEQELIDKFETIERDVEQLEIEPSLDRLDQLIDRELARDNTPGS